jgi:tetratricopeptide (TPR) repeat protein
MHLRAEAYERGDLDVALAYARQAARAARDAADLQTAIGTAFYEMGEPKTARRCFERAIQLAPLHPDAYLRLADLHLESLDQPAQAASLFRQAIALQPQLPAAYYGLCACLVRQGSMEDVLRTLRDGDEFPDRHLAYLAVADALALDGRYDEARICCEELLRWKPDSARAYAFLAEGAYALRDPVSSLELYQKAVQLAPGDFTIVSGVVVALVALGRLEEAKRAYLTAREIMSQRLRSRFPVWSGESLAGKTVLMRTSRGHGDAIQFARYMALAEPLGASVVVQTSAALAPLLRTVAGIDRVILPHEDPGAIDYECDFEVFGMLVGTTLEGAAEYVPYLSVPEVSASVGREIRENHSSLRVALAWEGRQLRDRDPYRNRAIAPRALRPLLAHDDVAFVAVQKGLGAHRLQQDSQQHSLVDLGRTCRHYGDTAAILSQVDLVICIDCSIAHLAGALGRPTWILLPYAADWRWSGHPDLTYWYPTARLFRQEQPGAWAGSIGAASAALETLLAARASAGADVASAHLTTAGPGFIA